MHFDNAWNHAWESLLTILDGVTEPEASWQAPCYRDASADEHGTAAGSIRWHVRHLAQCKRGYALRLRGDRAARTPDVDAKPSATWAEDMTELRAAHEDQRRAIDELAADAMTTTDSDFITNNVRHDTWHGGQIALVRRMWRHHARAPSK